MYFMLGCFGPEDQNRAALGEVRGLKDVYWTTGRRFSSPIPTPVEVFLDPWYPGVMVPMFDRGILLFSDAMIAALQEAGVDNLDCYPAVIKDTVKGITYKDYKAVNIIGIIACADLGKSKHTAFGDPLIDVDFDSLAIDEAKTRDALMFRLAECVSGIVVHEKVKEHLEAKGIAYLDFTPPGEWVG